MKTLAKIWNFIMVYDEPYIWDYGYIPGRWHIKKWVAWMIMMTIFGVLTFLVIITESV